MIVVLGGMVMKFTTNHKIVLASSSPRRKELLSKLGIPFEIMTSNVEETISKSRYDGRLCAGSSIIKNTRCGKKRNR